jgi:type I restriction enzyme S subunit
MKWERKSLTDCVWFQRGFDLPRDKFIDGEFPVVGSTSILGFHIEFKVKAPGIVTGRSGTIGQFQFLKTDFWPHNTSLWVKDFKGNDEKFAYYLLHTLDFIGLNGGGAIPSLNRNFLSSIFVNLPPLLTQRKIASILSVYDDLIENNLKRIKLLEEMAELQYKELMQEISNDKINRKEYIKDCVAFYIGGGWGEEEYKEGFTEPAYVIRGTDIPEARSGNISGIPLRYHKPSNLASRKMQVGDIVFEISNGQINNIGRTVLISSRLLGQFNMPVMCASFAKLIRVNEIVSPEFFNLFLNESQENGLLYQYKSNSANGINNFAFETFIEEVKITIPKGNELNSFTEQVRPIFTLISTLGEQNSKLREARDILLPRLMSGEIEV